MFSNKILEPHKHIDHKSHVKGRGKSRKKKKKERKKTQLIVEEGTQAVKRKINKK